MTSFTLGFMSMLVVWYGHAKARRLIIPYDSNTSLLWDDNILPLIAQIMS
jgi:hypothetical protein